MSSPTLFNLSSSRQVLLVRLCPKTVRTQPRNQVEWTRPRKCCDASESTLSLNAHIHLAIAMHIFSWPVALMCTGLLSFLVQCPGMACPRDRSHYKADTRKIEDGNVARDVCVNSVVCLLSCGSVESQEHHSQVSINMNHIIARRIRRHVRNNEVHVCHSKRTTSVCTHVWS